MTMCVILKYILQANALLSNKMGLLVAARILTKSQSRDTTCICDDYGGDGEYMVGGLKAGRVGSLELSELFIKHGRYEDNERTNRKAQKKQHIIISRTSQFVSEFRPNWIIYVWLLSWEMTMWRLL